MRTTATLNPVPGAVPGAISGAGLIRTLAGAALSGSAVAAAALALALCAPQSVRAETAVPARGAVSAMAAAPAQSFGPSVASAEEGAALLTSAALPAAPPRVATIRPAAAQFRLESGDTGIATVYRARDYDLRLEYGTVFYYAAAAPGQPSRLMEPRGRLMSRLVTRF